MEDNKDDSPTILPRDNDGEDEIVNDVVNEDEEDQGCLDQGSQQMLGD